MEFYRALSEYYDEIFPLKEAQKNFLHDYLKLESLKSVLDIGCGTGTFALELSQTGVHVLGVDLSEEMIEISRKKAQETESTASFSVADMRDLGTIEEQFDGILCLGNTLAHVSGEKGTHLILQIVNYDRILAQHVGAIHELPLLPIIKTSNLKFYRFYTLRLDGKLNFDMKIEFPDTRQSVSGVNVLFPIKCDILKKALIETGWEISELWGNFDKEPWTEDSPATVLAAKCLTR